MDNSLLTDYQIKRLSELQSLGWQEVERHYAGIRQSKCSVTLVNSSGTLLVGVHSDSNDYAPLTQ